MRKRFKLIIYSEIRSIKSVDATVKKGEITLTKAAFSGKIKR